MSASKIDSLDSGLIYTRLSPTAAYAIDRLSILAEVDSTSSWVKRQPEPGIIACLAENQTAGRGRRGREWVAPPGSGLLLSLRCSLPAAMNNLGLLSLQVGLAVRQAVEVQTDLPVQLKWPNDLILGGRKLAGVLVELIGGGGKTASGEQQLTAIIGVGLNVLWPATHPKPVELADCSQAKQPVDRNHLAARLLNALVDGLQQIGQMPACSVIAQWWHHDMLAGQQVAVEYAGELLIGRAAGIADDGGFVLDSGAQIRTFYSSETSIRLLESVT